MHIHVVQQGETVGQIAQNYGSNVMQVSLVNAMEDPNALAVGQALVVPDPEKEYVVQSGDQLWMIAERYGVSVEDLAQANNLTDPALIFVGTMLEIPYRSHTVQPGETLWSIAETNGITVEQLAEMNDITNPGVIQVGQNLRIPNQMKRAIEINAYTTNVGEEGKSEVLERGRHFTYLALFSYSVREDGSLTEMQEAPVLEAAQRTQTESLLVLTNFREGNFSSDLAASILRNPDIQETLITNLIEKMKEKGYQGINVDFEYVYPEDRENYNEFLRRLVDRMHPEGFIVSTAVAPKESGDQPGLLYEAHDYETHGQIVDFVIPMTYEWGWAGGPPIAIAPINKVRDILDYAVTVIPSDKILMGIPLYGRDWRIPWEEGTTARTISPQEAVGLAIEYNAAIEYNETYESPFFTYTDENNQQHEVWFEDARSMQAKYDLIKEYDLRGGSYWVLGNPFPQNWPVLQSNFHIIKH